MTGTKRLLSILLCFCLLAVGLYGSGLSDIASAETAYTGIVTVDDVLNVRSGPGTGYSVLGTLKPNASVTIYGDAVSDSQGGKWYKITFNGGTGYVSADYIKNVTPVPEYKPDADFETNLTAQGFPESYKALLRTLHAAHPDWIFLADQLSLTWEEAVNAESKVGTTLVSISAKDSWKSMEYGAYDWDGKTYISYDTGGWVTAEREVVAYYMEPRNFINEDYIYLFLDQSYNSKYQSKDGLNRMLQGTFMAGSFPEDTYDTYADVLMDAGAKSGVSPYVLAAMILVEQGVNGTGKSISGTVPGYEGYYNYFNYGAFADSAFPDAVIRGLWCASSQSGATTYGRPWDTRAKSILGGAEYYGSNYVAQGQDTLYYKKYNVIVSPYYTHQYMTNAGGAVSEAYQLKKAYADVGVDAMPLTFSIPVYKDMPSVNTTYLPTSSGANNYYLSALSVNGYSLTPSFSMFTRNYELVVDNTVSSVTVNASAVTGASVSGTGTYPLNVGSNTVTVTVKAASGKTAGYTLSIYRKEGAASSGGSEPVISGEYTVGTYITGIEPGTDVGTFLTKLKVQGGTAKVFTSSGSEKTSGSIGTGDIAAVYSGNEEKIRREIVIYGDNNGDGKISIVDLANIQKHLLNVKTVSGTFFTGADTNRDGRLSIVDIANIQKHLLQVSTIKQ